MIKGEVKLVFRDINTGEITKTYEQTNAITESHLSLMVGYDTTWDDYTFGRFIMIGTWDQPTNRGWSNVYDITAIGYVESGVQSPIMVPNSPNSPYIQYQNRFNPPTGTTLRTIRTVAIQYNASETTTLNNNNRYETAAAYVGLTTPCTQSDTETLDVFYRIIFDVPSSGLNWNQVYYLAGRMCDASTINRPWEAPVPYYNTFYMSGKVDPVRLNNSWFRQSLRGVGSSNGFLGGTFLTNAGFRARIQQCTLALSQILGRIVGTVAYRLNSGAGYTDVEFFHSKLLKNNDSPIQNIYGHSAAATQPFYVSSTAQSGDGTIHVNGDSWTNPDFAHLYRIDVVTSGGIGVGEYKLRRRRIVGFVNNTYENDHMAIPFMNGSNWAGLGNLFEGEEGLTAGYGPRGIKHTTKTNMVLFDKTWVGIIDVMTGVSQRWNGETGSPQTAFTNTRQVHVDPNGNIWVADDTGVYYINVSTGDSVMFNPSTTAQLSTLTGDTCYGVTTTAGGKVWALFSDGIASSTDNGSNWTIYSSAVFGGDNTSVYGINGDPSHADDRIAAIFRVGLTNVDLDIYWWDRVSDAVSSNVVDRFWYENASYMARPREIFQMFTCSPNDGIWGTAYDDGVDGAALYNWNTTTQFVGVVRPRDHYQLAYATHNWGEAPDGQDALVYHARSFSDPRVCMLEQSGTNTLSSDLVGANPDGTYSNYMNLPPNNCVWMHDGILCWNTKGNSTSQDIKSWIVGMYGINNNALSGAFERVHWETYGWNGSAWELDNPNGKPFHATDEALLDGITIRFGSGSPVTGNYVATEYYTFGVVDGVMADGATTFDHRQVYYMKPAVFNETDFETATLPASQSESDWDSASTDRDGAFPYPLTWTDVQNITFHEYYSEQFTGGAGGGRTVNECPAGKDCEIDLRLQWGSTSVYTPNETTVGLSNVSKKGTSPNQNTIDYGFRCIFNVTGGSPYGIRVEVVENGSVAHVVDAGLLEYWSDIEANMSKMNYSNAAGVSFRIKRRGTEIQYYFRERLVYTSSVPSSSALCVDSWLQRYSRINYINFRYPRTDYFAEFGSSTSSTGKFDPNFWAVVDMAEASPTVLIDGSPATNIGFRKWSTVLNAGEYTIDPWRGILRYSAVDAGKTITVDYTYLKNI